MLASSQPRYVAPSLLSPRHAYPTALSYSCRYVCVRVSLFLSLSLSLTLRPVLVAPDMGYAVAACAGRRCVGHTLSGRPPRAPARSAGRVGAGPSASHWRTAVERECACVVRPDHAGRRGREPPQDASLPPRARHHCRNGPSHGRGHPSPRQQQQQQQQHGSSGHCACPQHRRYVRTWIAQAPHA
jgi:hypothetical protein